MGFLDDYEPVDERNAKFWAKYPTGRIVTELVFDDGQRFTFRCELYRDVEAERPFATGYATENVTNSGVNKTSALENAETSAEGRALARGGFAPKGARPSREEMQKTERAQPAPPQQRNGQTAAKPTTPAAARAYLGAACTEGKWDTGIVANRFKAATGVALGDATDVTAILEFRESLFSVSDGELRKQPAANGASR